ncbi:hypothetical protein SAICODRAFT_10548 [Saitoella complicata NRRL Y-17804]|uniref:Uncharacterized protein n=1 Tax=Saitoella complicata (strain BCRC 22490 / CBS 7301 / JCM 7358 / NBRC 10748 / NRRL Y-17804) TaxID=698492 RepID=A0A0E9NSK4_SAICN|nr:uncharacterized protein SAICODRAFT_10548 [Saitoella complicata NRRL Y-17804]ODQ49822.1 hypothetical protein SAICODRAFT_10548 [Saitoella complicata NRRL Y-17804]GAO52400.1 hypothetical protein G7K_6478-t1 [Saitoella complicata NRRL Y-17804]
MGLTDFGINFIVNSVADMGRTAELLSLVEWHNPDPSALTVTAAAEVGEKEEKEGRRAPEPEGEGELIKESVCIACGALGKARRTGHVKRKDEVLKPSDSYREFITSSPLYTLSFLRTVDNNILTTLQRGLWPRLLHSWILEPLLKLLALILLGRLGQMGVVLGSWGPLVYGVVMVVAGCLGWPVVFLGDASIIASRQLGTYEKLRLKTLLWCALKVLPLFALTNAVTLGVDTILASTLLEEKVFWKMNVGMILRTLIGQLGRVLVARESIMVLREVDVVTIIPTPTPKETGWLRQPRLLEAGYGGLGWVWRYMKQVFVWMVVEFVVRASLTVGNGGQGLSGMGMGMEGVWSGSAMGAHPEL